MDSILIFVLEGTNELNFDTTGSGWNTFSSLYDCYFRWHDSLSFYLVSSLNTFSCVLFIFSDCIHHGLYHRNSLLYSGYTGLLLHQKVCFIDFSTKCIIIFYSIFTCWWLKTIRWCDFMFIKILICFHWAAATEIYVVLRSIHTGL